ncbi:digeranylgeranylglycerophospholipid reductase [Halalkalicoccus subterraneus]|uniref:digeranylgeranylglycerophospholipid reductase n=1 Tax=Halalkalicoccus subterraneus TaxID=2675002 RepID=UPI000EFB75D4|nr:digeranylgeranylglycerophospholipid reductase [Halalkalicoccus subterraneus]
MDDSVDVLIAGAGPAGAQCARDLAARDYDVTVLETEPEEGFPRQSNKSTGGTFPSMLTAFGIPDDVVMNFTDNIVIESPNEHFTQEQPGGVLDFGAFKRWLVEDGREKGAQFRFDARVSNPITEGGEVIGVQYDGSREAYADVVIDATGPSAPLARALGVSELKRGKQAIGIEYEFEGVDLDAPGYADLTDAMMLRLDHSYAPGGYAWIFHTGADTAKVGLCYIQNESYRRYVDTDRTVDGYLQHWLDTDPRFANAEQIAGRNHRGSAHIQPPGSLCTDGFMAIGDAVPSIDPLWGEGIHKGMRSARAAAITADRALTPDDRDTSAESLSLYEQFWHEYVAPRQNARLMMTELLYLAPNERYDDLLRDLNRLDWETLSKANEGNKLAMLRLLQREDLPLLARYVKHRLAD